MSESEQNPAQDTPSPVHQTVDARMTRLISQLEALHLRPSPTLREHKQLTDKKAPKRPVRLIAKNRLRAAVSEYRNMYLGNLAASREGGVTLIWSKPARDDLNLQVHQALAMNLVNDKEYQRDAGIQVSVDDVEEVVDILSATYPHLVARHRASIASEVTTDADTEARRQWRFQNNIRIIAETPALCTLLNLWLIVGVDGTSTDEEAEDGNVYSVPRKTWRSSQLETFCRFLADYIARIHPEPHQRTRVLSVKVSTRAAPRRLPSNWYSKQWLKTLNAAEVDRLNMTQAIELEIPESLQE